MSCSYPTELSQNVIPQKMIVKDEISVIFVLKRGAEVSGSASLQRRIRLYTARERAHELTSAGGGAHALQSHTLLSNTVGVT